MTTVDERPAQTAPVEAPGDQPMTMLEHLTELRNRIIISGLALLVGMGVALVPIPGFKSLTQFVIDLLVAIPDARNVQLIRPGEYILIYLQVAIVIGAALAMPVILYQVLRFVLPALLEHEKKYLFLALPGAALSFVFGIAFGYGLLLPAAIQFLLGFSPPEIKTEWALSEYISTVTTLLFWMGATFQTPLLMFFLTKLGIVGVDRLQRLRKYVLVGAFVVGAVITPTPDPVTQTIVSLPLYLLFEIGILLARLA